MFKNLFLSKNFFLLWTGKFISEIGDRFYGIALAWWIFQKTNSPSIMGLFMVLSVLSGLLLSPVADSTFYSLYSKK